MRFLILLVAAFTSSVIADSCENISLISCLAAPVQTLCNSGDTGCVCSQLNAQTSCYPKYCPTTGFDDTVQSVYNAYCGGSSPATTTVATGGATTVPTTTGSGSVAAKTGAAGHLVVPAVVGGLGAIIGGAIVGF